MDFQLTEDHKTLREAVRAFAQREIAPLIRKHDQEQTPIPDLLPKMAQEGLLGICIPKKYGGQDMDYISLGIVCEELERVDTAPRVVMSVHVGLNSMSLLQWGTEAQKQKYLVPQAKGEKYACFGLTEPDAGSDVPSLKATAKKVQGGYVVNGEKTWISLANTAHHFLMFAVTDRAAGRNGMTAFIVERSFKGLTTTSIKGKLGVRAGDTGSFACSDMFVPDENRLGEEGEGLKIAYASLDNGRYTVAAGAVGIIEACLEASVKYGRERKTFGKPLVDHQLIQAKIARMAADAEISRLLCHKAGWLKNQGKRNTCETSLAKWYATEAGFSAANEAIQVHGAYGYSNEFPVERFFRNARGGMIYEGTSEIQALMQAAYVLGLKQDKPLRKMLPSHPFS